MYTQAWTSDAYSPPDEVRVGYEVLSREPLTVRYSATAASDLTVVWHFGDGTTADVSPCSHNGRTFYGDHAWALPGAYEYPFTGSA